MYEPDFWAFAVCAAVGIVCFAVILWDEWRR